MVVNSIKIKEGYINPEEIIDISDKKVLNHLLKAGAVVPVEATAKRKIKKKAISREESIKALKTIIAAKDDKIANALYDGGLKTVNDVSEQSVSDLKKIKGISEEVAQKIYDCFEE